MILKVAAFNNYKYFLWEYNGYYYYIDIYAYNKSFRKLAVGGYINQYKIHSITFRTNINI
jgi:hypothetical protein